MNALFQKLFYTTGCVFELARGVIIFAVVLALVNSFLVTVNIVNGPSMEPNFHSGQYVVVDKSSYIRREPRRGEAVIVKFPGDPEKTRYIKRIIGLPGEKLTIVDNRIYINGQPLAEKYLPADLSTEPDMEIELDSDEYFIMGDNRPNSNDSRVFKAVERRFIIGLAYLVVFPPNTAGLVPPQFYNLTPAVNGQSAGSRPEPGSSGGNR